jgi:hypothetical protein
MIKYLTYASIASLVIPALVIFVGDYLSDMFVLIFWPSSILLMSFGGQVQSTGNIIYVWSIAIAINTLLYVFLTFLVTMIIRGIR